MEKNIKNSIQNNKQAKIRKEVSDQALELMTERKNILHKPECQHEIAKLNKKIRKTLRKDRKRERMKTLNECIIKTGGVNKAIKKLEINKEWILKINNKNKKPKNTSVTGRKLTTWLLISTGNFTEVI